jgi:formylglycine-generating enzyme required for sulfatase activity
MGSLTNAVGVNEAAPVYDEARPVLNGYYIGVYAVTEKQYTHIMGQPNPHFISGSFDDMYNAKGDNRPVVRISWNDIRGNASNIYGDVAPHPTAGFLGVLSNKVHTLGGVALRFDLPTEAQWEVACRAGSTGTFSFTNAPLTDYTYAGMGVAWSNAINEVAWWDGNHTEGNAAYGVTSTTESVRRPVGLKRPNPAGLYDMHGNVNEWCLDNYDSTFSYPLVNNGNSPVTVASSFRTIRGGIWNSNAAAMRPTYRYGITIGRTGYLGFRLIATGTAVPEP